MRVAVWRCFDHDSRSSDSHYSINGTHGLVFDGLDRLTGGLRDRSRILRYLRTVGSLTCSSRAIAAIEQPSFRIEQIEWTTDMLIIAFRAFPLEESKYLPVKQTQR